ncbi:MAG: hypothetical protein ACRDD1_18130 [Planctomycetia bacterium]
MAVSGVTSGGGGSAIRAGRAFVELFADDNRLYKSLNRASTTLQGLGEKTRQLGYGSIFAGAAILGGISALFMRVAETGKGLNRDEGDRLAMAGDAVNEAWESVEELMGRVVAALLPTREQIVLIAGSVQWLIATVRKFIDNNTQLIRTVVAVGAALVVAGVSLIVLGTAFTAVGYLVSAAVATVSAFATVLGFLISPIGLVLVAVAGLGYAFFTFTQEGENVLEFLRVTFGDMLGIAQQTATGIADAIMAGDWEGAAEIAGAGLEVAWLRTVLALEETWSGFKAYFVDAFRDAVYLVEMLFVGLGGAIAQIIVGIVGAIERNLGGAIRSQLVVYRDVAEAVGATDLSAGLDSAIKAVELMTNRESELKKAIDLVTTAKQNQLAKERQAKQEADNVERQADLQQSREQLAAAQARLDALTADAAAKAKTTRPDFRQQARAADSVAGSFSGPFALMFGQGSIDRQQLGELKKIREGNEDANELLQVISDKIGGVFL